MCQPAFHFLYELHPKLQCHRELIVERKYLDKLPVCRSAIRRCNMVVTKSTAQQLEVGFVTF